VATGVLPPASPACQPAFVALNDTIATRGTVDVAELSEGSENDLLVTMDFARTIDTSKSGSSAELDSFQRPVQWILTALHRGTVTKMLVISPYEAQELYTGIQASTRVALHLYTPRCNNVFRSLDRLDFYTVPHQPAPPTIHPRLVAQLNLFAGQLYFNNYEDFKYMCSYVGLAVEVVPHGWEVAADGFILSDDQGKVGGAGSRLTRSPVKFLQTLIGTIRRDGEGISKTQMGALLEGRLLQKEDFEG